MTDATVHIIPLYTFSIKRETKRDNYDHIIISDSVDKIIEGIADLELQHEESFEKNWKYFRIEDFIVLPKTDENKRGKYNFCLYRLSDDLTLGFGGDDDVYEVYIKGDIPVAVPDLRKHNTSGYETGKLDEMFSMLYASEYVAKVIYTVYQSHPIKEDAFTKYNETEGKELAAATIIVAKLV